MHKIKVTMLGEFSIAGNGVVLREKDRRSPKMWLLLEYLIVNRKRIVDQHELIDILWGGTEEGTIGALKTLIHRLRKTLSPLFGEQSPIVNSLSSYSWNNELDLDLDTDEFERLCMEFTAQQTADEARFLSVRMFELYKSGFLPNHTGEQWVKQHVEHFKRLFLRVVKIIIVALARANMDDEISSVCQKAIIACGDLDAIDKIIYSLIDLTDEPEKNRARYLSYADSESRIVKPSERLFIRTDEQRPLVDDFDQVVEKLSKDFDRQGTYYCEYGSFKSITEVELRMLKRTDKKAGIMIFTVIPTSAENKKRLEQCMECLGTIVKNVLRISDVYSLCSHTQYIILLHNVNEECRSVIFNRVNNAFGQSDYSAMFDIKGEFMMVSDLAVDKTPQM